MNSTVRKRTKPALQQCRIMHYSKVSFCQKSRSKVRRRRPALISVQPNILYLSYFDFFLVLIEIFPMRLQGTSKCDPPNALVSKLAVYLSSFHCQTLFHQATKANIRPIKEYIPVSSEIGHFSNKIGHF